MPRPSMSTGSRRSRVSSSWASRGYGRASPGSSWASTRTRRSSRIASRIAWQRGGRAMTNHEGSDTGIFAGLFVASPADVEAWDMTGLTPPAWPAIEFKRLDSVRLGTLEAILTGGRYEDIDRAQLHRLVRNGGDDGPWIMGVRQELIGALADLGPDGM